MFSSPKLRTWLKYSGFQIELRQHLDIPESWCQCWCVIVCFCFTCSPRRRRTFPTMPSAPDSAACTCRSRTWTNCRRARWRAWGRGEERRRQTQRRRQRPKHSGRTSDTGHTREPNHNWRSCNNRDGWRISNMFSYFSTRRVCVMSGCVEQLILQQHRNRKQTADVMRMKRCVSRPWRCSSSSAWRTGSTNPNQFDN